MFASPAIDHPVWLLLAAGIGGVSLGFGLVIGAFVARALRAYMAREDIRPYSDKREDGGDHRGP
jgi:multisubunit Na+/H+ antiporter MnhE subunit